MSLLEFIYRVFLNWLFNFRDRNIFYRMYINFIIKNWTALFNYDTAMNVGNIDGRSERSWTLRTIMDGRNKG